LNGWRESEQFQGLCKDYDLALQILASLESRALPSDTERVREYHALVKDLERDVAEAIKVCRPGHGRPS
jgi:hypothetical protein